jgi:hypothetical protein
MEFHSIGLFTEEARDLLRSWTSSLRLKLFAQSSLMGSHQTV